MIAEQLREQAGLSPIERTIANYFLDAGDALHDQSARSIGARLNIAASTVTRLCKRLGYRGYNDFRNAYLDELRYLSSAYSSIDANQPFRRSDDIRTVVAKIGALYRETVDDTLQLTEIEALEKAVHLIANARNVFVYASGPQSYLVEDFADKMARIGKRVIVSHKSESPFFFAAGAQQDEAFIAISYSGETSNILRFSKQVKAARGSLVAITSFGRNSLSQLADVTLHVSTREKLVEKLGSYGMPLSTMLLLDIIYSGVLLLDYNRNVIRRVTLTRDFELGRDSSNPILHDRRN